MQFVISGPDIPNALLQEHEEGRVVFFCGSGISIPAGLPDFPGLVERLYSDLIVPADDSERRATQKSQYDVAIGLLEDRMVEGALTVRRQMANILTPDWAQGNVTRAHKALLTLSRSRKGEYRLVTTNFDRIFERVVANESISLETCAAPFLPIPKRNWAGLVYLHGLLEGTQSDSNLKRLVLTSGDFGRAYLTERWAARFVSELFRNYTVCFVGYGLNDPVLRYMMDALAADRSQGESVNSAFVLAGYTSGLKEAAEAEWKAKRVVPILYDDEDGHENLYKTLEVWSEIYRDGISGKEGIIAQYASSPPMGSTQEDDYVGRVLWALSDREGLPAKRFADLDPVPPLEWLEVLSESRFGYEDLVRFRITPSAEDPKEISFSLLNRPSPYTLSAWMSIAGTGQLDDQRWDDVMFQLARWLTRHLDDPKVVLWLSGLGGPLLPRFLFQVQRQLDKIEDLEIRRETKTLESLKSSAPNAIPRLMMRKLWRIILAGYMKTSRRQHDLYGWRERFKKKGLTVALRKELRDSLAPRIRFSEAVRFGDELTDSTQPARIKDIVDWELVLASKNVRYALGGVATQSSARWQEAMPNMLPDLTALLLDACRLARELDETDEKYDRSYIEQPSILQHSQNRGFRDWTVLIDLNRESWLATADQFPDRAKLAAISWWMNPYPLFKRLAFMAASEREIVPNSLALEWLLSDNYWWLWHVGVRVEVIHLLQTLGPKLVHVDWKRLEVALLQGPPKEIFGLSKDAAGLEEREYFTEKNIWLRLATIKEAGVSLGVEAEAKLAELVGKHSDWNRPTDEKDSFPFWIGEIEYGERSSPTPGELDALIKWIEDHPERNLHRGDDWHQRCRDDFENASQALLKLAQENKWFPMWWAVAISTWSDDRMIEESWQRVASVLVTAPDDVFEYLATSLGHWMRQAIKISKDDEATFFGLARRVLDSNISDAEGDDETGRDRVFEEAINHPVGSVTDAVMRRWHQENLKDNQKLSSPMYELLTSLGNPGIKKFQHARVVLAANVVPLYRVDKEWSSKHLLPIFDWGQNPNEAPGAWEGFLWSPRFYPPLMHDIKAHFLETAQHYAALGSHAEQYAAFLVFSALQSPDVFSLQELVDATSRLPTEGLERAAQELSRQLEASGEQRSEFWKNRIKPYIQNIWPKTVQAKTEKVAEEFARLAISAKDQFPEAIQTLTPWLKPISDPFYALHLLGENISLCSRFPEEAMTFLDSLIGDDIQWTPPELGSALRSIYEVKSALGNDARFQRLTDLHRRLGGT